MPSRTFDTLLVLVPAVCLAAGCGVTVKRDLRETPARKVVYDDMCGLQSYHDMVAAKGIEAPFVVSTQELENTEKSNMAGGRTKFAFTTPVQLETLRRVLGENWDHLPAEIQTAKNLELEVRWSVKAGVKRVVTEEPATLTVDQIDHALPYHVCLSELLFGQPLYETRRELLGLPPVLPGWPIEPTKPEPLSHQPSDQAAEEVDVNADAPTAATPAPTPAPPTSESAPPVPEVVPATTPDE